MKVTKFILLITLLLASYALAEQMIEKNQFIKSLNFLDSNIIASKHPQITAPWFTQISVERKCTNELCKNREDGFEIDYIGEGRYDTDYDETKAYLYSSVSMKMTYNPGKSDEYTKDIQYIAVNYLETQSVDHYLMMNHDNKCTSYHHNYGIAGDQIQTFLNFFTNAEDHFVYKYNYKDLSQTSSIFLNQSDNKTIEKIETIIESKSATSKMTANYKIGTTDKPEGLHHLFFKYTQFVCRKVDTFVAPYICIDGILGFGYGCK